MTRFAMSALPLSLLCACATSGNTEKDFLCAAQAGQPCRSISEVDGTSTGGRSSLAEAPQDSQAATLTQEPLIGTKGPRGTSPSLSAGAPAYTSSRYRIPEKTGSLWIAPHLDDNAILHEATNVHFVIREAAWGTVR